MVMPDDYLQVDANTQIPLAATYVISGLTVIFLCAAPQQQQWK